MKFPRRPSAGGAGKTRRPGASRCIGAISASVRSGFVLWGLRSSFSALLHLAVVGQLANFCSIEARAVRAMSAWRNRYRWPDRAHLSAPVSGRRFWRSAASLRRCRSLLLSPVVESRRAIVIPCGEPL